MKSNESHFLGRQNTLAFLLTIITTEEVWMDKWKDERRSRGKIKETHTVWMSKGGLYWEKIIKK